MAMDGHNLHQNKVLTSGFSQQRAPSRAKSAKVLFRNGLRLRKLIKKNELSHALASSELHTLTSLLYQLRADGRWRALF